MAISSIEDQFQALGIGTDETRVYLALLELGRAPVALIAKRADVARVNCYHLLENLKRKGLAAESQLKSRKVYSAETPDSLVKQQVERVRVAENLLPELKQRMRAVPNPVALRQIEGEAGVKMIFEETLSTAGEILAYSNLEALERLLKDYLHYYAEERLRRRIRTRIISPFTRRSQQFITRYFGTDQRREFSEIVFVDPAEFPFDSDVYVYGDKVASFSTGQKRTFGFVIESAALAQTYRSIFNLSWLGGTSFILS